MKKNRLLNQQGLSLIELLVSLALGTILLLGVVEVFVSSKQTYRVQDSLSEMQENARFAVDLLVKDLRLAGYLGCGNLNRINPQLQSGGVDYQGDNVVQGFQNTGGEVWDPAPPAPLTSISANNSVTPGPDSDLITIKSAGACSTPLQVAMASIDADINIDAGNACGFGPGDTALISDCTNADIFELTAAPSAGAIAHPAFQKRYNTSAEVLSVKNVSYFTAVDPDSEIPSLYMYDHSQNRGENNPIALIEGVESIQVELGEDTDENSVPDEFRDPNEVIAWENVLSAKVTLLMRSTERVGAGEFVDPISNVTYDDGVLRKTFVTTVQFRNRG